MFGVCVYCAMVTYVVLFSFMTTDAVSDEWCVFNINFLYSHFVSFYFIVIIVTSPEICVGKCWMICDNKRNMQRPLTSVSGMTGEQLRT